MSSDTELVPPVAQPAAPLERRRTRQPGTARRQAAHNFLSSISLGNDTPNDLVISPSTTSSLSVAPSIAPSVAAAGAAAAAAAASSASSLAPVPAVEAPLVTPPIATRSTSALTTAFLTSTTVIVGLADDVTDDYVAPETARVSVSGSGVDTLSRKKKRVDSAEGPPDAISTAASLASLPISVTTYPASPAVTISPEGPLVWAAAGTLVDRADRASYKQKGVFPQKSSSNNQYIHLDSPFGLGATPRARLVMTTAPSAGRAGMPFGLFSFIRYSRDTLPVATAQTAMQDIADVETGKGISNESMLRATTDPFADSYDPHELDDPQFRIGKHHHVISLPGVLGSIIRYTRPSDLKKEQNEKFRAAHPELDASMSLSKIHSIKERLIETGTEADVEAHTIACAFVLFERLVLKNFVNKANRFAIAAACLLLAAKMGDWKESTSHALPKLTEAIEQCMEVSPKTLVNAEFGVLAALEFDLNVPNEAALPHLSRIISSLHHSGLQEYLGASAYSLYRETSA